MASIRRRPRASGPRWSVRYRLDGEPREKTFKRRSDAEAFKRRIEADEVAGLVIDPRAGEQAFGPYAEAWVESRRVKGKPLSPTTVAGYKSLLRRFLIPAFGRTPLRKITPDVVRNWYAELAKTSGQDPAAKSYRLLRAVLNTAVSDDILARNPCRIRGGGIEHSAERPMLDATTVLTVADAVDPRYRALVLLAGFGGLRTGEMLGLSRRDVDLMGGLVHVRHQSYEVKGKGRVLAAPKSEAGRRTVVLPALVVDALGDHLRTYAQPGPDGAVFTGPLGTPLRRATLSKQWREACAAVGLERIRVHDLRHHAATAMARMPGITTKELMARIGHASPRAALIYQHATEERDRTIAAFLDGEIASAQTALRTGKVTPIRSLPRAKCGPVASRRLVCRSRNAL
ncbi:MAG TPA: site-specific integrase [Acidimicrobiales bacterium]|nr:site-specific integrase [Acidimicrobiales bacterium]